MTRTALSDGDGLSLLSGPSGSGKSSVFAAIASELASTANPEGRRFLPIFMPVAAQPEAASDLDAFGRGAIAETLAALRNGLPGPMREKLERGKADEVRLERRGPRFNARLVARVFGAGGDAGIELGGDLVSIAGKGRLDARGGLRTLSDIVRTRGLELVVIVEDTDAWAITAGGEEIATAFFSNVLRPVSADVELAIGVAVQDRWADHRGAIELRERAVGAVSMPEPADAGQAARLVGAVLARRIEWNLGDTAELGVDPAGDLFSADALEALAGELRTTRSMRAPLATVRDTLDRLADDLPDRIEREHLLDSA
jgi:hypothetical protein